MRFIPLTEVFTSGDIKDYGCKEKIHLVNAEHITDFVPSHPDDPEECGIYAHVHIYSKNSRTISVRETVKTIWEMIHDWTDQDIHVRFREMEKNL